MRPKEFNISALQAQMTLSNLCIAIYTLNFDFVALVLYPCSTKTREVLGNPSPRVEENLEGGGDGFPNTSRVLVEHRQSLSISFSTGSGSENPSLWTGKD